MDIYLWDDFMYLYGLCLWIVYMDEYMDVYMDEYMNVSEWIYGCMSCV